MWANLVFHNHVQPLTVKLICKPYSSFDITSRKEIDLIALYGRGSFWFFCRRYRPLENLSLNRFRFFSGCLFVSHLKSTIWPNYGEVCPFLNFLCSFYFIFHVRYFLSSFKLRARIIFIKSIKMHYGTFCLLEPTTLRGPKRVSWRLVIVKNIKTPTVTTYPITTIH